MTELPHGWSYTTIGDVCNKPDQRKPEEDEHFIYIDIGSLNRNTKRIEGASEIIGKDAPSRARKMVDEGDVIVSMTRPNLNAVAKIDAKYSGQIASTGFDVLNPVLVETDLIFSIVKSEKFIQAVSGITQGALYPACKAADIRTFKFGMPPLPEQKRIVEKLDSLLAQVDTIQQRLNNLPNIIKRFRQSVLAAAVSGKLTEQWRGENVSDALADLELERSLIHKVQKKIETTSNHESVTNDFPKCWGISTFDAMYRFIDYRGKTPKKSETGKRLITAKNIKMGFLSDEPVEYVSDDDYVSWMTRGFPQINDLFFVTEGHTMGCVALNSRTDEFALAQRTITLQPYGKLITHFYYYYILTNAFQILVESNATGSAAKGIKAAKFRGLPLPFPSYKEQTEIVRLVEQHFALAVTLENNLANAKQRVDNLTQSILAKAFKGELVPQDPNDEPADKLLERIKAAREETELLAKAAKKITKVKNK
jgi:type I restriction enzyme S subunit